MDKKLNILFISSWFPNKVTPTNGNFVEKHAEAVAVYCNVLVIHIEQDPSLALGIVETDKQTKANLTIINIYLNESSGLIGKWKKWRNRRELMLEEILKQQFKPDLIHGNVFVPSSGIVPYIAKKYKIPFVYSEHSSEYKIENRGNSSFVKRFVSKRAARLSAKIMPVSNSLKNEMIAYGMSKNSKYVVIPNVAAANVFNKGDKPNEFRLIHISNLKEEIKNVFGMFSVLAKLKSDGHIVKLHIVSDKDTSTHLKEASRLNLLDLVTFQENASTIEVANQLKKSSALLMFSNYENLPCVIIEALCCGLPVVSSNVGGIPEMVSSRNGILVAPRDEIALKQAILSCQIGNFNRKEISEAAIENYSYQSVAKQFLKVYKEVIE